MLFIFALLFIELCHIPFHNNEDSYHLLDKSLCDQRFTDVILSNLHNSPVRDFYPYFPLVNWDTEGSSDLAKITQLVSHRARVLS